MSSSSRVNTLHLFGLGQSTFFLDHFLHEAETVAEIGIFSPDRQDFFGVLDLEHHRRSIQKEALQQCDVAFEWFGKLFPMGLFRLVAFVRKKNIHAVVVYGDDDKVPMWVCLLSTLLRKPILMLITRSPFRGFFFGIPRRHWGKYFDRLGFIDPELASFVKDDRSFSAPLGLHPSFFNRAKPFPLAGDPKRIIFEIECLHQSRFFWRREKDDLFAVLRTAIPHIRKKYRKSMFRFQKQHRALQSVAGELRITVFLCRHFPNEAALNRLFQCLVEGKPFLIFSEDIYPSQWREYFSPLLYPLEKEVCETVLGETVSNPADLFRLTENTLALLSKKTNFSLFLHKVSDQVLATLAKTHQPRLAKLHRARQAKPPLQFFSDDDFFSLLQCPICAHSLIPHITHHERKVAWSGTLTCTHCDGHFPIIDGIPHLYEAETTVSLATPRLQLFARAQFSQFENTLLAPLRALALDHAGPNAMGLVLNVGQGFLLREMAFYGARFIGIDGPHHLQKAPHLLRDYPNARLIAANPERPPLQGSQFSMVIDVQSVWDASEGPLFSYQKYINHLTSLLTPNVGHLFMLSFQSPQVPKFLGPYWSHLRMATEDYRLLQKPLAALGAIGQNTWENLKGLPSGRLALLYALWLQYLKSADFILADEKIFRKVGRKAALNAIELHHHQSHLALTARR